MNDPIQIPIHTILTYRWSDILEVFPGDFQTEAEVLLHEKVVDHQPHVCWSVVPGHRVERILHEAWEAFTAEGLHEADVKSTDKAKFFGRLPSLVGDVLVAI